MTHALLLSWGCGIVSSRVSDPLSSGLMHTIMSYSVRAATCSRVLDGSSSM